MSQVIIDRLSTTVAAALALPEVRANAQKILFEIHYENQEAISRASAERFRFYQDLSKKAGLKPE